MLEARLFLLKCAVHWRGKNVFQFLYGTAHQQILWLSRRFSVEQKILYFYKQSSNWMSWTKKLFTLPMQSAHYWFPISYVLDCLLSLEVSHVRKEHVWVLKIKGITAFQLHVDLQRHFVSNTPSHDKMVILWFTMSEVENWTRYGAQYALWQNVLKKYVCSCWNYVWETWNRYTAVGCIITNSTWIS